MLSDSEKDVAADDQVTMTSQEAHLRAQKVFKSIQKQVRRVIIVLKY